MITRYLAQDTKFIEELVLGVRQEAPIIVTTTERMHKYPGKKTLLGLYDIVVFQQHRSSPMLFCLRKASEEPARNMIDHSDLAASVPVSPGSVVAGEIDEFMSIDLWQLCIHYFTHLLISLEAEIGVSMTVDDIVKVDQFVNGYPVFKSTVAPHKTWDAVQWTPFFKNGHFAFQVCFNSPSPNPVG